MTILREVSALSSAAWWGSGTVRVRVRDANLPLRLAPSSIPHLGEAEQPRRLAQGRLALGTHRSARREPS